MMRFLKQHLTKQKLPGDVRVRHQTLFRWLYLAAVFILLFWLFDLFFGGLFYLRSDGLVLGEPGAVAAEFAVTIRELRVQQGDAVKAGQVAAIGSSQHVAETIARLTADMAARQGRLSDLRVRSHVVDALLPLATNRLKLATHARQELNRMLAHGTTGLNQRTQAVEQEYRAQTDMERLKAEESVLKKEIGTLTSAMDEVKKAIADLRRLYDDGRLRAPIDGIVGRRLASTGSVLRPGSPLFELWGNNRYVLAYLPTGTLYRVQPGDEVQISTGLRTVRGKIKRIEPYAAALPNEFQRAFTPVERQQVMRVEFEPGTKPPPLLTKVWLTSSRLTVRWLDYLWRYIWPI
jgi:multidrug resistance efflux pump